MLPVGVWDMVEMEGAKQKEKKEKKLGKEGKIRYKECGNVYTTNS